jgi:hypothetical protein
VKLSGTGTLGVGTTAGREVRSQLSSCPRPILLCAKIALKMTAGVVPVPDNLPSHVSGPRRAGKMDTSLLETSSSRARRNLHRFRAGTTAGRELTAEPKIPARDLLQCADP